MRAVLKLFIQKSVVVLLALAFLANGRPLQAETWQNGGNGLWGNPLNWDIGIPTSGSAVAFDAAGSTAVNLGGVSRDLFSLTFNSNAQGYTLSGNPGDVLNFSSTGSILASSSMVGPQVINSAIGLNGGAFSITNDDTSNSLTLGGAISLVTGTADVLTVAGSGNTAINGAIPAGVITNLSKTGTGTLTLSGANAAYAGTTTILGGTIATTSSSALGTGTVIFGDAVTAGATGTLHVTQDLNFGALSVRNIDAVPASAIVIDSGKKLTVGGAFTVGNTGSDLHTTNLNVSGSGTLAINTTSDVTLGFWGAGGTVTATVDLTSVGAFDSKSSNFYVGAPPGVAARPTASSLLLSNTSNSITATNLMVANSSNSTSINASTSTVVLGEGSNVINVDNLTLGAGKARGRLNFAATTPGSGTVMIAGRVSSKANIFVGNYNAGGTPSAGSFLDLRGHDANVTANTLEIGRSSGPNSADPALPALPANLGIVFFDRGTFTVDSLNLAPKTTTGIRSASAELSVGGGVFQVNSLFQMGSRANGGLSYPTVNLTGGTLISKVDILEGVTPASITSTFTLDGGTLDLTGHVLGNASNAITNLNFRSGTLSNVLQINGGAGLTKTTAGTLNLTGANAFTGNIAVNHGTLNIRPASTHNLGAGGLTVAAGATLGVQAFNPATSVIVSTGPLSFTDSTLNLTLAGNPTAPLINTLGSLTTAETNTVNIGAAAGMTSGTYTLIDYAGAIGGAGFAGLTLGATPLRTTAASLVDNVAGSSVDLNISIDSIRWGGGAGNVWNINSANNWKLVSGGTPAVYLQPSAPGEPVRFDDNADGNFNVNVAEAVNPVSVRFDNTANNYTLSGTGDLTTPTIAKLGAGTATISTSGALSIGAFELNGPGAVVIDRADNPTLSSTLAGTGTLRKAGADTLTLDGNSFGFTGTVDIAAGTLKLGSNVALGSGTAAVGGSGALDLNGKTLPVGAGGATITGAGPVTSVVPGTLQFVGTGSIANPITGTTSLAVTAPGGVATITGGANTYSGTTQLTAGTLALSGGNNRLSTIATLAFNPDNIDGATATLDLGSTNQSVAALTFPTGTPYEPAVDMIFNVVGTGTLTIDGDSNFLVGAGGTASLNHATNHHQVLNMSGLSNFVYDNNAGFFQVRFTGATASKATNVATVNFAANNTITAASMGIATGGGGGGGGKTTLRLGQTNAWKTNDLVIGGTRADADVRFAAAGSSLTIRGLDGMSALPTFTVGQHNDNSSTRVWDDVVDLTDGTTDAIVQTMVIGVATPSGTTRDGTVNGTLILGAGDFRANDLTIGAFRPTLAGNGTDSTMRGNGTFRLNNAAGTLHAPTIRLADAPTPVGGTGAETTSGILNIVDGRVKATSIALGSQVGVLNGGVVSEARIDFAGGTIENTDGANLTISAVPIVLQAGTQTFNALGSNSITVDAASPITGTSSGINKTGPGTLVFNGTNTYDAPTTVSQGTLGGSGTINSATTTTVNTGATIAPGSIAGSTFTIGSLTLHSDAIGKFELENTAGVHAPGGVSDYLDVVGTLDISAITTKLLLNLGAVGGGNLASAGTWTLMSVDATNPGTWDLNNIDALLTVTGIAPGFSHDFQVVPMGGTTGDLVLTTTATGGILFGDYNNDTKVNAADYVLWRKNVGQPLGTLPNDNTGANPIGNAQYGLWRSNFGNPPGSGSGLGDNGAVPEPSTLALVALAGMALVSRRSTRRHRRSAFV